MAAGFAAAGWNVSGCTTDASALQLLADELGKDHLPQPGDVTDPSAVEKIATAATKRFGAPDLLLNNVATINSNKSLWEVIVGEFSRVIDVNLKVRSPYHSIFRPR
jgi:NAD(P)-dependent dehydrogenase (short-subunit alcohol dehydrogenase family)